MAGRLAFVWFGVLVTLYAEVVVYLIWKDPEGTRPVGIGLAAATALVLTIAAMANAY